MTREIHKRILKPSQTRQGKFSKREGLFQKPLDIFQGKREEMRKIHPMLHMLQCYMLPKISGTSNSHMLIPLIPNKLNLSTINIRLR